MLIKVLFLVLLFFPSLLLAGLEPQKNLKEICAQKTGELHQWESQMEEVLKALLYLRKGLKNEREEMDKATKLVRDLEMGNIPQVLWDLAQKGRDTPVPKDQLLGTLKKAAAEGLERRVRSVESTKKELQKKNGEINQLSAKISDSRGEHAKLGCEMPPEKTWNLHGPETETQPVSPPPQSANPYQPFLGNWKGEAKVTKSSEAKYIGLSSPYHLSITAKEGGLELTDSSGLMGKPSAYKIKQEGSTLQVDYSGPPNFEVPQVETLLTFTVTLAVSGNKLTGTVASTTKSVYEGPAGTGSATLFMVMGVNLERAP